MAFRIQAKGKTAELWLYCVVGDSWWDDCITAKQFADQLNAHKDISTILLHINSPGGCVFDGIAIYNLLRSHKARVEVEIEGLAASIASVIAMSGDVIRMAANSFFMIHDPWTTAMGTAKDMRDTAIRLDLVKSNIVDSYMHRTSDRTSRQQVEEWMDAETWLTAQEALDVGFIHEISNSLDMAASADRMRYDFKRYGFKRLPQKVAGHKIPDDVARRAGIARMQMHVQQTQLAAKKQAVGKL